VTFDIKPAGPAINIAVVSAGTLLCFALGTVHAFSVFLEPLESSLNAGRASVSFTYSLALISITLAVLIGPVIFARLQPRILVMLAGLTAVVGCLWAGFATSIWHVWAGYGVVFGLANGLGYGFSLQMAALASPQREGLAMGIITASYALGAAVSPAVFSWSLVQFGFAGSMGALAMLLVAILPAASIGMQRCDVSFLSVANKSDQPPTVISGEVTIWLAYGAGVLAGLMVIGHAAAIASARDAHMPFWLAPVIVAACNLVGSLLGGAVLDRVNPKRALPFFPCLSALGLLVLLNVPGEFGLIAGLACIGFAYGALIAALPAAISKRFGALKGTQVYGRVFTAWGSAGLLGPWLAGLLFDWNANYEMALWLAIACSIVSIIAMRRSFN